MRSSTANYDSILTATDSNVINRTGYFAQGTNVSDREVLMSERNYTVCSDSGFILLLLLCLGIIASIFHNSRPFIVNTWRQFFKKERKYSVKGVITKNFWVECMWQILIASFTRFPCPARFLLFRHGHTLLGRNSSYVIAHTILRCQTLSLYVGQLGLLPILRYAFQLDYQLYVSCIVVCVPLLCHHSIPTIF